MSYAVYLAMPFSDGSYARIISEHLRRHGLTVTSTWAEHARGPENFHQMLPEQIRQIAIKNDFDVKRADCVLLLAREGAGGEMFAEARYALELGKPVYWVGRLIMSAFRQGVIRCEYLDEAVSLIVAAARDAEGAA